MDVAENGELGVSNARRKAGGAERLERGRNVFIVLVSWPSI